MAKIAIVHSDPAVVDLLVALLRDEGYEPLTQIDPIDAVAEIRRRKPDLAIIDLGFELSIPNLALVDKLRNDPLTRHIPILALTTSADIESVRPATCRENCEILQEPFDINSVLGLIRSLLWNPHHERCG